MASVRAKQRILASSSVIGRNRRQSQLQQVAVAVIRTSAEGLRQGLIPGSMAGSWEGRNLGNGETFREAQPQPPT
jgi:hypothetical protein